MMIKKRLSVKDICTISIFAAIISIFAIIRIPMPYGVPMTLQTFVIPLAGIVIGAKNGMLSTLIYILLGTLGLPIFSGFTGGIGVVLGPTGGFIISFPVLALTAGIAAEKGNYIYTAFGLVIGSAINYICGMLFYSFVTSSNIEIAFTYCVLPFIPTAIIKIILAGIIGIKIKKIVLILFPI